MAPEKGLDKVRKLINLSASSNLQEAQLAAYKACSMIRELGLDIVDPAEIDGVYEELAQVKKQLEQGPAVKPSAAGDPFYGQPYTPRRPSPPPQYYAPRPAPTVTPTPPRATPPPSPTANQQPMTSPIALDSKFKARCKQCQKTYNIGDKVLWQKGVGTWCPTTDCYANWLAGVNATAAFNPFGPNK